MWDVRVWGTCTADVWYDIGKKWTKSCCFSIDSKYSYKIYEIKRKLIFQFEAHRRPLQSRKITSTQKDIHQTMVHNYTNSFVFVYVGVLKIRATIPFFSATFIQFLLKIQYQYTSVYILSHEQTSIIS